MDFLENMFEFTINPSDIYKTQYPSEESAGFMTLHPKIEIFDKESENKV